MTVLEFRSYFKCAITSSISSVIFWAEIHQALTSQFSHLGEFFIGKLQYRDYATKTPTAEAPQYTFGKYSKCVVFSFVYFTLDDVNRVQEPFIFSPNQEGNNGVFRSELLTLKNRWVFTAGETGDDRGTDRNTE